MQVFDSSIYHRQSADTPPTVNAQRIGRESADTSTEISADSRSICRPSLGRYTSVDKSTDISRSTYRPRIDRYVDRHIDRHSTNMPTDTSVESRSIRRPIYRSWGAQNTHDPSNERGKESAIICFPLSSCFGIFT